tara:strand:- start:504 stop:755 length:252 start_codon:yes stop_codon:yes gene_type:complete
MNNTGGPAFPHVADLVQHSPNGGITTKPITSNGMTLRDYFAAKAMQGLIASPRGTPDGRDGTDHYYAKCAYLMADAMLKEREA